MIKKILIIFACFFFLYVFILVDKSQKNLVTHPTAKNAKLSYFEDQRIKEIEIDFGKKTLRHFLVLGELIGQGDFLKYNQMNNWKKANVKYGNKLFKAEIKLHGKRPDGHSYGFIYHSYSIKLKKGDTINGFRRFKLIVNKRLDRAKTTLKLAKMYDVLSMPIFPVKVYFNEKKFSAEYSFIPNIDETFSDKIGKGTLYFFKEFEKKNSYNELDLKSFVYNIPYYLDNEKSKNHSEYFNKKLRMSLKKNYNFNATAMNQILNRFTNLNNSIYLNKNEEVFEYFDEDYILKYLLVMILSAENGHQHVYGNQKVAYDFATGFFYPFITWDSTDDISKFLNTDKTIFELMKYYSDQTYLPFINYLVSNLEIQKKIIFELNRFIQLSDNENYIDNEILSNIDKNNFLNKLQKKISEIDINNQESFLADNELKFRSDLKINEKGYFDQDKFFFNSGEHIIDEDLIFPRGIDVVIKEETKITLKENISLIINGSLSALGSKDKPIIIESENDDIFFGVFAIIGGNKEIVKIENMKIQNSSEKFIGGKYLSGGLSIYNFNNVHIKNFDMLNSKGEDGVNIKYAKKCKMKNIKIINSTYDAIDVDNCDLHAKDITIKNFRNNDKNGDGLDLYYSKAKLENIEINGFNDKGISVGENSILKINNSNIYNNEIGIAVKDDSCLYISNNNEFNDNTLDISIYNKKNNYGSGTLINNSMKTNLIIEKDENAKIIENLDNYKCF